MNLIIDRGNSYTKIGVFNETIPVKFIKKKSFSPKALSGIIKTYKIKNILLDAKDKSILPKVLNIKTVFFNHKTPLPIVNKYRTPKTLGIDRIASVVCAHKKFPGKNCLVIDAGTCITMDFITKSGLYIGGSISPGIVMRFKALHTFTRKLPLLKEIKKVNTIGDTTISSIQSGVVNGAIAEMYGITEKYKKTYKQIKIILTGGDANFLKNYLKKEIFVIPEMVLIGLNEILEYNKV